MGLRNIFSVVKAIVFDRYGGPEVLHLAERNKPVPADNEVLVKVYTVSVNDWDWGMLQGGSFIERLMSGAFKPKKQILGSDIAGIIEAIGKNIKNFKPGDEVFGDLSGKWGGFAEYVCAAEEKLAIKSPRMSFEEAAAIPQAGMLAYQALVDAGKIKEGQKLLINGAGGGVGTLGIQIAKHIGAEVTVVDKAGKLEMLRSLGADHLIDYTKEDFTKRGIQYDMILDVKTSRSPFRYLKVLKKGGKYITVGGVISKLLQVFLYGKWIRLVHKKKTALVVLKPNKDLEYFNKQYEAGRLKPIIGHTYKLEEVQDAFRLFEKADHKGKIVIIVRS